MPSAENPFHPFKAVAIDLDGTLLKHDLSISPENRSAIDALHEAGVHIILASGRHHLSMLQFAKQLPQVEWMVSAQGAFAADVACQQILYDHHLPPEKVEEIIDAGLAANYQMVVYSKTGLYALTEGRWNDYYSDLARITPDLVSKKELIDESVFKVIILESEERINQADEIPTFRNWSHYKVRSLKNIYEFAGESTSKAHGLKPVLDRLGIKPSELATFGDAPNDIPMFQFSGYSVAMDEGWQAAKDAAHAITPPGDPATAFARAIEMLKAHSEGLRSMSTS